MNISYNWLKELIDIDLSPEETAKALTRVGLAVEGIHPHRDDLVLDIDLTSNRPDCLSHLGIARELRVATGKEIPAETESRRANSVNFAKTESNVVKIEAPDLCHRFTARVIRGVKVGPSPQWLVDRLEAVGERSINNIADITNYVMLELGQPMHAFDLDKLAENRIVVRAAKNGESITTLDEVERELDDTILMICDAEKPVAVAGIMGGLDSGITDSTQNVLLEVAYFRRESIRSTSRKLNLSTEASYRFERGVDIANLTMASDRATELILELAGGTVDPFTDLYPERPVQGRVNCHDISGEVARLTGLSVDRTECDRILNALGIVNDTDPDEYLVPTWRHDIAIVEDLVEEITRHTGYELIQDHLPPAISSGEYQPNEQRERMLRGSLRSAGAFEILTYSFIDENWDDVFNLVPAVASDEDPLGNITLQDAIIDGAVRMRRTLLPGMLTSLRENFNQQRRDLCLFEIGKVFAQFRPGDLPTERKLFSIGLTGKHAFEGRSALGADVDLFDLKGIFEAAIDAAGIPDLIYSPADIVHLRRGQSAVIKYGDECVGSLGRLNEEIATKMKFRQPVYLLEVDLEHLFDLERKAVLYRPLAKFPGVVRDVSFVVDRDFRYSDLSAHVASSSIDLLDAFTFVDVYEGKGIPDGQRSLTVRFSYRSDDRTLSESEVESAHDDLLADIATKFDIKPRS